jgi:hypothetical protein
MTMFDDLAGSRVDSAVKIISKLESEHVYFFNAYVLFEQILIKIMHLYIIQLYVSKLPRGTYIKSKWIPKYADCDIRKRMSNYCLSVKHTQSSNYC